MFPIRNSAYESIREQCELILNQPATTVAQSQHIMDAIAHQCSVLQRLCEMFVQINDYIKRESA